MTDSWRGRILRELADVSDGLSRVSEAQARQLEQQQARTRDELEAGLAPGQVWPGGRLSPPNLAGPLSARLDSDFITPNYDAGASATYSANLLRDPLMETILGSGAISVGTSWTSVGGEWEARKRSISGALPTVTAQRTHSRKLMEGGIYKSDVLVLDVAYGGVGASWVELRPKTPVAAPVHIDWPWCVPVARVYIDKLIRPWTNLVPNDPDDWDEDDEAPNDDPPNYVRMSLVNGAWPGDDDPDETGDEHDLEELSDDRMEAQIYVGTEDVDKDHWWLLQLRTESLGAGGIALAVAEPQVNYTYQEAPMPFDPDIGNYDPPSSGEAAPPYDPVGCTPGPATGGTLTAGAVGHFHEDHAGAPPGLVSSMTGPTGTDINTLDVGTSMGIVNHMFTEPPAYTDCFGIGIGSFTNARHTGLWASYTVTARPSEARAGIKLTVTVSGVTFPGKSLAVMVKAGSAPSSVWDGATIDSRGAVDGSFSVLIPASLIPAVGQVIWIGVVPLSLALEGSWDCNPDAWPYDTGHGGSWKSNVSISGVSWATPCEVPGGARFANLDVGIGDGSMTSFSGWATDGPADWYVDGLLTEPVSYDGSTGVVIFDRAPARGAPVEQSGVAA